MGYFGLRGNIITLIVFDFKNLLKNDMFSNVTFRRNAYTNLPLFLLDSCTLYSLFPMIYFLYSLFAVSLKKSCKIEKHWFHVENEKKYCYWYWSCFATIMTATIDNKRLQCTTEIIQQICSKKEKCVQTNSQKRKCPRIILSFCNNNSNTSKQSCTFITFKPEKEKNI